VTYCKYLQEGTEEKVKKSVIIAAKWHEPIVLSDAGQQQFLFGNMRHDFNYIYILR
jgi:hypothetical protein